MANEVTLVREDSVAVNMSCADDAGIEKGAILKMTDNMVAVLADGDEDICAGICAGEKIAGNGITSVAVFQEGLFRGTTNAGVTVGDTISTAASSGESNELDTSTASAVGSKTLGTAMETASADGEFLFELKIGVANQAYA